MEKYWDMDYQTRQMVDKLLILRKNCLEPYLEIDAYQIHIYEDNAACKIFFLHIFGLTSSHTSNIALKCDTQKQKQ